LIQVEENEFLFGPQRAMPPAPVALERHFTDMKNRTWI
jgi:hypothetical protein